MTNTADFLDEKAKQDPKVRERLRKAERAAGKVDDHATDEQPEVRRQPGRRVARGKVSWMDKLICGDRGPVACEANVVLALRADAAFVGRLRFNELALAVECGPLPWRACDGWRSWTDLDDYNLAVWMQNRGVLVKDTACTKAVQIVAADHPCHPVRAYLDECATKWDGTKRLDGWLATYLGVKPETGQEEYLIQVGRCWPVSAVARVYNPGAKADCAFVLEGSQGKLKSSAIAALCPREEWFTDQISDLGTKDSSQDLAGKWLVELPELSAMGRADIKQVKAYLSRKVDHYRASYGRRSGDYPRQCVFAGTTNESTYIGDTTGGRRFWPVVVGMIDLDALKRDRDQLWGEAVHAYRAHEQWWLTAEAEVAAVQEQDARRVVDPWEEPVLKWANGVGGDITVENALFHLNLPRERHDQASANRIARILKADGWERVRYRAGSTRAYAYRKVECPQSSPVAKSESGDEKASVSAAVPTVPTVPSRSDVFSIDAAYTENEKTVDSGDTGGQAHGCCVFRPQ